jgi:hypothetical protein
LDKRDATSCVSTGMRGNALGTDHCGTRACNVSSALRKVQGRAKQKKSKAIVIETIALTTFRNRSSFPSIGAFLVSPKR